MGTVDGGRRGNGTMEEAKTPKSPFRKKVSCTESAPWGRQAPLSGQIHPPSWHLSLLQGGG